MISTIDFTFLRNPKLVNFENSMLKKIITPKIKGVKNFYYIYLSILKKNVFYSFVFILLQNFNNEKTNKDFINKKKK